MLYLVAAGNFVWGELCFPSARVFPLFQVLLLSKADHLLVEASYLIESHVGKKSTFLSYQTFALNPVGSPLEKLYSAFICFPYSLFISVACQMQDSCNTLVCLAEIARRYENRLRLVKGRLRSGCSLCTVSLEIKRGALVRNTQPPMSYW